MYDSPPYPMMYHSTNSATTPSPTPFPCMNFPHTPTPTTSTPCMFNPDPYTSPLTSYNPPKPIPSYLSPILPHPLSPPLPSNLYEPTPSNPTNNPTKSLTILNNTYVFDSSPI